MSYNVQYYDPVPVEYNYSNLTVTEDIRILTFMFYFVMNVHCPNDKRER